MSARPWSQAIFFQDLFRVRDLLGELHYVDAALPLFGEPLGESLLNDPVSSEQYVIGWTHPVVRRRVETPLSGSSLNPELQRRADRGMAWADGVVQGLVDRLEPIVHADVEALAQLAERLRETAEYLDRRNLEMGATDDNVGHWHGDAADEFRNFSSALFGARQMQTAYLFSMAALATGAVQVIAWARGSLMSLVDDAAAQLDQELLARQLDSIVPEETRPALATADDVLTALSPVLGLASSLLGLVAAPLTGGASAVAAGVVAVSTTAASFGVAASATGLLGDAIPDDLLEWPVISHNAQEIAYQLDGLVDRIFRTTDRSFAALSVEGVGDVVRAAGSTEVPIVPPRPTLLTDGGAGADDFVHNSAPTGPGLASTP